MQLLKHSVYSGLSLSVRILFQELLQIRKMADIQIRSFRGGPLNPTGLGHSEAHRILFQKMEVAFKWFQVHSEACRGVGAGPVGHSWMLKSTGVGPADNMGHCNA